MDSGDCHEPPDLLPARKINVSHVFAEQNVGVTQVGDHI
jgi:hypothetical protein